MNNTQFPGLNNYTGPIDGYFGLLHHAKLYEHSHDVMERVAYVKRCKPKGEIEIRLRCMVLIPDELALDCNAICDKALKDCYVMFKSLKDCYAICDKAEQPVLDYIMKTVPNCPWNGKKMVF